MPGLHTGGKLASSADSPLARVTDSSSSNSCEWLEAAPREALSLVVTAFRLPSSALYQVGESARVLMMSVSGALAWVHAGACCLPAPYPRVLSVCANCTRRAPQEKRGQLVVRRKNKAGSYVGLGLVDVDVAALLNAPNSDSSAPRGLERHALQKCSVPNSVVYFSCDVKLLGEVRAGRTL
jgi:hypothetical protein